LLAVALIKKPDRVCRLSLAGEERALLLFVRLEETPLGNGRWTSGGGGSFGGGSLGLLEQPHRAAVTDEWVADELQGEASPFPVGGVVVAEAVVVVGDDAEKVGARVADEVVLQIEGDLVGELRRCHEQLVDVEVGEQIALDAQLSDVGRFEEVCQGFDLG